MPTKTQIDIQQLTPLARVIATTVEDTRVRLGSPEGAADLVSALTVKVAAYMGSELPRTPGLAQHMVEVDAERQRQLAKFGDQHHPDGTGGPVMQQRADEALAACQHLALNGGLDWRAILLEEVYEALAEDELSLLRAELVQCAAVIQAWISDIDSRES